jgi:hypothetical protein
MVIEIRLRAHSRPLRPLLIIFALLIAGCLTASAVSQVHASDEVRQLQTTASHKVLLEIGPPEALLMPSGSPQAKSRELIQQPPGDSLPSASTVYPRHFINHHLYVYVWKLAGTTVDASTVPIIHIVDNTTGTTEAISHTAAMYDATLGQGDLHVGNDLSLANGRYTVTVSIASDTSTSSNITIADGTISLISPSAMPAPSAGAAS